MNGKGKPHENDELRLLKQQETEERREEKKEYLESLSMEIRQEEKHKKKRPERSDWKEID